MNLPDWINTNNDNNKRPMNRNMKRATNLLMIIGAAALVAIVTGCASTNQTENLLSAAGFKAMPASTPQQQAHLKTLPPHKVTRVVREGKTYYAYPDQAHQVLYVGQEAQYQEYQRLRLQNQMAEEQAQAAEMNSEADWSAWGAWGGLGGFIDAPPFRR
jgi:hypothetical protein